MKEEKGFGLSAFRPPETGFNAFNSAATYRAPLKKAKPIYFYCAEFLESAETTKLATEIEAFHTPSRILHRSKDNFVHGDISRFYNFYTSHSVAAILYFSRQLSG